MRALSGYLTFNTESDNGEEGQMFVTEFMQHMKEQHEYDRINSAADEDKKNE